MKLREKTILTITFTFIGLIIGLYFVAHHVVMKGFLETEENLTFQNLKQLQGEIQDKIVEIDERNIDWSRWDETYNYAKNRDKNYYKTNLSDDNYSKTLKVNFILFFGSDGRLISTFGFNLYKTQTEPVPEIVTEYFKNNRDFLSHKSVDNTVRGIVTVPNGPAIIVSSRPIVTSEGKGPIVGSLIFGRYLDKREIGLMEAKFRTKISIIPRFIGTRKNEQFIEIMQTPSSSDLTMAMPLSEEYIAGYSAITDYTGKPVMALKIVNKRTIYQQGKKSLNYLTALLFWTGLVFSLANLLLMERVITARLIKLNESVKAITKTDSAGINVRIGGNDEISNLSTEIDRMLKRIKQSQDNLREKDLELRNLVENTNVGIFKIALKPQCTVLEVNNSLVRLLGYQSEDELKGKTFRQLISDSNEAERLTGEILDGIYPWNREIPFAKKDGSTIWVMCKFGARSEGEKNLNWIDGIVEDITRDKTIKTLLLDKNRELNDFAYTVSHDLKNPLNILEGYLMAIKGNPSLFENYFEKVIRQADRLIALINNLLSLSRAGQAIGEKRRVILEDMVAQVYIMTKPQNVSAKLNLKSSGTALECDASRMQQVFDNLISNSIRYRDPAKDQLTVTFEAVRQDENIRIIYEDNGSGIKEEFIDKIFNSGFTTAINLGTGLGLSIVKKIIEAHSGSVKVESDGDGKGTRFIIVFPADSSEVAGEFLSSEPKNLPDSIISTDDSPEKSGADRQQTDSKRKKHD